MLINFTISFCHMKMCLQSSSVFHCLYYSHQVQ